MKEQLGLVQRLRNGGQNDLADDAERLMKGFNEAARLLTVAAIMMEEAHLTADEAATTAYAALAQVNGGHEYEASVLAEHNSMQVREDRNE